MDPSDPQSFNRDAYVLDDPANHIDSRGLDCSYADQGYNPDGDGGDATPCTLGGGDGDVTGFGDAFDTSQLQTDENGELILDAQGDPILNVGDPNSSEAINVNEFQIEVGGQTVNLLDAVQNGDVPQNGVIVITGGNKGVSPNQGYWRYFSCFVAGVAGAVGTNPEVGWFVGRGLRSPFPWVRLAAGVAGAVAAIGYENGTAYICSKITGYTPWILEPHHDSNPGRSVSGMR